MERSRLAFSILRFALAALSAALVSCSLKVQVRDLASSAFGDPAISIQSTTVNEGFPLLFQVALVPSSSKEVVFSWRTINSGTAVEGVNYDASSGSVTIAPGASSAVIEVPTKVDHVYDSAKTLGVSITYAQNAIIANGSANSVEGQAIGTILNVDPAPTLSISSNSGNEGSALSFTVTQSILTATPTTVRYQTTAGSALDSINFVAKSSTLTIPAGSLRASLTIASLADGKFSDSLQFTVDLSDAVNAIVASGSGTGTILNTDAQPSLSILAASAPEGSDLVFTVTLSAQSRADTTVIYQTQDVTAVSGVNYTPQSNTLTILAGSTSGLIVVPTLADGKYNSSRTLNVNLSSPMNASIATGTNSGTITNTDGLPLISIASSSANEGSALNFVVSLSAVSALPTKIDYTTVDGTALAASQYTAKSGTLTIAALASSATISVATLNDGIYSGPLTMSVALSSPVNGALGAPTTATGTINNLNSAPSVSVAGASANEGASLAFVVTQSASSLANTSFVYITNNNTAIAPRDYTTSFGVATIAAGQSSTTILVPTINNSKYSADLLMNLAISSPLNASIAVASASGTIVNLTAQPTLSVAAASSTEGTPLNFVVTQSASTLANTSFNYAAQNGTAISGTNYTMAAGAATILAGQTTTTITAQTLADGMTTANLTMTVSLSGSVGATLAASSAVGTIVNTDGLLLLTASAASANEGSNLVFTVTQDAVSGANSVFSYATRDGTALAGSNYTAKSATATIPSGSLAVSLTISTISDGKYSLPLNMYVDFTNPTGGVFVTPSTTGTINNLQAAPTISIAATSAAEGSTLAFTVTQSAVSGANTVFSYATSDGTAVNGVSYLSATGWATIAAGSTSTTLSVNTLSNGKFSNTLTMNMVLSNLSNAGAGTLSNTGSITNTDGQPQIAIAGTSAIEGSALTFTVTQSAISLLDTTFSYATSNGTALAGTNYTQASGTATLSAGTTSKVITVTTLDDSVASADLTMSVSIGSATGATVTSGLASATIINNNPPSVISVSPTTGSTAGGTTLTISGTGFLSGATVRIGSVSCAGVSLTPTSIVCTTGASSAGAKDVTVTNTLAAQPSGPRSGALTLGFTYVSSLAASPLSFTIFTGESQTISASGGVPGYTYTDGGSGYLNTSTRVYSAPFNIAPLTETLSIFDSVASTATSIANIRAFELKDSYQVPNATGYGNTIWNSGASDGSSKIYVVGQVANTAGVKHWHVRQSSDDGVTLTQIDDFVLAANQSAVANDLVLSGSNTILVAGYGTDASGISNWIVRKSGDGGASWSTVDQKTGVVSAEAKAISRAPNGDIYVAGTIEDSAGAKRWVVRKSTNGGSSWTTVDDYLHPSYSSAVPADLAISASGDVFVVGSAGDTRWVVRKSTNSGSSWTTAHDYVYGAGLGARASSVAIDSLQNIFVIGPVQTSAPTFYAAVNKSSDGGANWSTSTLTIVKDLNAKLSIAVDGSNKIYSGYALTDEYYTTYETQLQSSNGGSSWSATTTSGGNSTQLSSYFIGASNAVFIAGGDLDSGQGFIRKSSNGGSSWSTQSSVNYTTSLTAYAAAGGVDSANNIYIAGTAQPSLVNSQWQVRKSSDGGVSWSDADIVVGGGQPNGIAFNGSSTIIVAGDSNPKWVTRRSANGGGSWSTVDNYSAGAGKRAAAKGITFFSTNSYFFATGYSQQGGSNIEKWVTRRSTDGGVTWANVDTFSYVSGKPTVALAISSGTNFIWTVGYGTASTGETLGVIRYSNDGSLGTWTTYSTIAYSPGKNSALNAVATNATNTPYIAGYGIDSNNFSHWVVLKNASRVDDFVYSPGYDSVATGVTIDTNNIIYVSGYAYYSGPYGKDTRWIVRRSKNLGTTWTTVEDSQIFNYFSSKAFGITAFQGNDRVVVFGSAQPLDGVSKWVTRILSP